MRYVCHYQIHERGLRWKGTHGVLQLLRRLLVQRHQRAVKVRRRDLRRGRHWAVLKLRERPQVVGGGSNRLLVVRGA